MNTNSYLALNAWLQTSDDNYISGRLLWLNEMIDGACNLLWLSCEQIIKILILQNSLDAKTAECKTVEEVHCFIDNELKKKYGHGLSALMKKIDDEYPDVKIMNYKKVLEKLNEFFNRRYYV